MTTFWKYLHGLAKGQLLNGGYLAPGTAWSTVEKQAQRPDGECGDDDRHAREPWPRLAAYR